MRATRIYLIVSATLIGNIAGVLAMLVVARFMGADALGMIAYWLAFTATFSFPLALELDSAHLRIVPIRETDEERSHAIGAFASLKFILILASIGSMLVAYLVQTLGKSSGSQDFSLFSLFALALILTNGGYIFSTTFAAFNHTAKQQLPQLVSTLIRSGALVVVAIVSGSILLLGGAYAIAALLYLVMALLLFRGYRIRRARRSDFTEYLKLSGPMMAAPIFAMAIMNIDKIVLGISFDSSVVGVYYAVQTMAFALLIVGRSARVVLIPGFSQDLKAGRLDIIENQSKRVARFVSMLLMPLIAFAWFFSGRYLGWLFGSAFSGAGPTFALILAGVWFSLLTDPLTSFIVARGDSLKLLISNIIGFAVSISLLLLIVPKAIGGIGLLGFAGFGAAMAFLVSYLSQMVYYRSKTRELRTYFPLGTVAKIGAATASAVVLGLLLVEVSASLHFKDIPLIILPVLFFGITAVGAYFMRELSKEDIRYLRQIASTRSLVGYVKDELRN